MNLRQQKAFKVLAVFLAFSFAQVYVQTSFADPSPTRMSVPIPQQFVARLSTRGNAPITVNGASASSGATILTGATIETPDQVGATINLGSLGTLDIAPNTKLTLEFDKSGNVKVKLIVGCVVLKTKKGTNAEVEVPTGSAGKSDKKKAGALDVCFPAGATGPTGGAVAAGAGAGAAAATGGAAGGLFGLGVPATIAILGGAGAITTIAIIGTHGHNPSP
ncbi:MAG TPA: hypothetical protein VN920_00170 [Pyrinomonadaceae bacterium]|nr:hypothetical protein [Pyrinomonadaceae bacterium]